MTLFLISTFATLWLLQTMLAILGYDLKNVFWNLFLYNHFVTLLTIFLTLPLNKLPLMEISPDGQLLAACGYQHIRMFDVHNTKPNPVVNFEGMNPILIWKEFLFIKMTLRFNLKLKSLLDLMYIWPWFDIRTFKYSRTILFADRGRDATTKL